jgi:hypothetical protein
MTARLIVLYGVIGGLIVGVPMIWQMLTLKGGESPPGMLVGYLTMIVALTTVFLGIKQYRDKVLGGVIRFGPALLVGLGISAVASLFYVIAWEISLAYGSNFDFLEFYTRYLVDGARARGATEAEVQQAIEEAKSFAKSYANPLFRMSITFIEIFPVGVLISLISAAVLRNSRVLPARTTP